MSREFDSLVQAFSSADPLLVWPWTVEGFNHSLCCRAWLQMAWVAQRFGNWHSIYTRMNRWTKSRGHQSDVCRAAERADCAHQDRGCFSGFHQHQGPSGWDRGAKNGPQAIGKIARWMEHQGSYGCRRCSNSHNVLALAWSSTR